jgi:hypothetical protein
MAPLTERQQKAQDICDVLREKGVPVVNSMPLADDCPLRFRVLATRADSILQELRDKGWDPRFLSSAPEFRLDGSTPTANTYEIHLLAERVAVPDGRIPAFPLAEKVDPNSESAKMLKEWFGAKKAKSWR